MLAYYISIEDFGEDGQLIRERHLVALGCEYEKQGYIERVHLYLPQGYSPERTVIDLTSDVLQGKGILKRRIELYAQVGDGDGLLKAAQYEGKAHE